MKYNSVIRMARISAAFVALMFVGAAAQANDIVVCKANDATSPVAAGSSYSFTIDGGAPFSLTVDGDCMEFHEIGAGNHIITEAAQAGTVVSNITVDPVDRLIESDLSLGTVTAVAGDDPTPTTVTFYNAEEPVPLTEGCTPGYWKQSQHFDSWPAGFTTDQTVGSIFTGIDASLSGESLLTALQGGGGSGLVGAERILLRAAVAALLNSGSVAYPYSEAYIISAVDAALATGDRDAILTLATTLDNANNGAGGCTLS